MSGRHIRIPFQALNVKCALYVVHDTCETHVGSELHCSAWAQCLVSRILSGSAMRHIIMNLFLFSAVVGGFSCCCDGPTKPDTDSSLGCSILPGGTGSFWVYIDSTWRDGALQPVKDVRLTVTGASIQDGRVVYTTDATAFLPSTFTSECDTTFSVTMARGGQSFLTPIFLKGRTQPDTFMTLLGDVGVLFWAQEFREALRTPSGVYEH